MARDLIDPESQRWVGGATAAHRFHQFQAAARLVRRGGRWVRDYIPVAIANLEMRRRSARIAAQARARAPMPRRRARNRRVNSGVLTTQRDQQLRYTGRGRRTRRFVTRVRRAITDLQESNNFTVDGGKVQTSTLNQCAYWGTALGATTVEDSEVTSMFTTKYGAGNISNTKLCLRTQVLDVEVKNNGTSTAIIDIYTVKLRRTCANSNLETQYTNLYNIPFNAGGRSPNDPGSSPFVAPEFCRMWKILSKREVRVAPGELVTMQLRVGKDKWVNGYKVTAEPGYLRGSLGYLFHWHGAPEKDLGPPLTSKLAATELCFTYQKQYLYGIPPGQTQDTVQNA